MERSRDGLTEALKVFADMTMRAAGSSDLANAITAARLITVSALLRCESRGSHYRSDFPESDDALRRHSFLTLRQAEVIAAWAVGEPAAASLRLSA